MRRLLEPVRIVAPYADAGALRRELHGQWAQSVDQRLLAVDSCPARPVLAGRCRSRSGPVAGPSLYRLEPTTSASTPGSLRTSAARTTEPGVHDSRF